MDQTELGCGGTSRRRTQEGDGSHGLCMSRSAAPTARLLVEGLGPACPGAGKAPDGYWSLLSGSPRGTGLTSSTRPMRR